MRKFVLMVILLLFLPLQVFATEEIPTVPSSAQKYMPENTETFGQGILEIISKAAVVLQPTITESVACCAKLLAASMLLALFNQAKGISQKTVALVGTLFVSALLLATSSTMTGLASETVEQVSSYGNMLTPILTGTLAASGGGGSAVSLYTGTIVFDSILSSCINILLNPTIQLFLVLSIANSAIGDGLLVKLRNFVKYLLPD